MIEFDVADSVPFLLTRLTSTVLPLLTVIFAQMYGFAGEQSSSAYSTWEVLGDGPR